MRITTACIGLLLVVGCAANGSGTEEKLGESVSQPIVNGQNATSYLEAALVNMPGTICSGAVIAPKVVLTAGHCVAGESTFNVVAPYANKQSANGVSTWTEYTQTGEFVNASKVDVAVIVLDKAIELASYPKLSQNGLGAGTKVVNVGRIDDGTASFSSLFYGKEVTVSAGSSYGFPYSYITEEVIQPGDSGGPVYLAGSSPRTIVAVNSGAGGGTQVLARVDLVYQKIQDIIAQTTGTAATPKCSGTAESEPNDDSSQPNALAGTACGALDPGTDVDWYSWSVSASGIAYEIALDATGDADVLMWKWNGSAWSRVQNSAPDRISATSSSAGQYLVAVRSASGNAQGYTMRLTK